MQIRHALLSLGFVFVACGGDSVAKTDSGADAADTAVDSHAPDIADAADSRDGVDTTDSAETDAGDPNPLGHGQFGAGGGPIAGSMTVFVVDANTHEPLPDVAVHVHRATGADLTATTDQRGLATITEAGLVGPVELLVSTSGYGFLLIADEDRKLVSLTLTSSAAPEPITLSGEIFGIENLPPAPDPGQRMVGLTPSSPDAFWAFVIPAFSAGGVFDRFVAAKNGSPAAFSQPAAPWQTSMIAALGGVVAGPALTSNLHATHLGVARFGEVQGADVEGLAIDLDHPLDQMMHLVAEPPEGTTLLGRPGCLVILPDGAAPCAASFDVTKTEAGWDSPAPKLEGDLADGIYAAHATVRGPGDDFASTVVRGDHTLGTITIDEFVELPTATLDGYVLTPHFGAHTTEASLSVVPQSAAATGAPLGTIQWNHPENARAVDLAAPPFPDEPGHLYVQLGALSTNASTQPSTATATLRSIALHVVEAPSVCDVAAQDCPKADAKCTIIGATDPRSNVCVTAGSVAIGAKCNRVAFGDDDCAAGGFCTYLPSGDISDTHCRALCDSDADCGADEGCYGLNNTGVLGGLGIGGVCLPHCTLWGDGCEAGAACKLFYDPKKTRLAPFCSPPVKKGVTGDQCVSQSDCDDGYFCRGLCEPLCDDAHPCADNGRCTAIEGAPEGVGECR